MFRFKKFWLIVVPAEETGARPFHLPRWALAAGSAMLVICVVLSGLFLMELVFGVGVTPGRSSLARQNAALRDSVANVERQVVQLRETLADVASFQDRVAAAVDLPAQRADVLAASIGGREPLAGLASLDPSELGLASQLEQLLRQARLQREGLTAILDTVQTRAEMRERIPSIRPTDDGRFTSSFGLRRDPFTGRQAFHRGVDFSLPVGSPVRATGTGTVRSVATERGLGLVVEIDHGGGVTTAYGHLSANAVETGQRVRRGQVIARSGDSGRSTAPHLHYEVRVGGRAVNPLGYILDGELAGR